MLAEELPAAGTVLEVASGTGEHVVYFAQKFPHLHWQPSDPSLDARASILAWTAESGLSTIAPPLALDAAQDNWPDRADAILCINMVHISPITASDGLVRAAGQILPPGAPLVLYGPWLERGVTTAPSNQAFDASLRARDPRWGLRSVGWMDNRAAAIGLRRTRRVAMPANNIMLVYRRF